MADMEDDDAMFGGDDMEEEEEDDDDVIIPISSTIKTETTGDALLHVKEDGNNAAANNVTPTNSNGNNSHQHAVLPTTLPSTSPFPHHNAGPTSDRLRNAMSRISTNPTRDAEAWQALITEAQSCYRTLLPNLHLLKNNTAPGFASSSAMDDNNNNNNSLRMRNQYHGN